MASLSAEAIAAKFLADLVKSREQASSEAIAAASAAVSTPTPATAPIKAPTPASAEPSASPPPAAAPAPAPVSRPLSQQIAAALQQKSDATDELVAIIDSGDLDVDKISELKTQIAELNVQLKLLEAQDAQAKIAAVTHGNAFPDERVMPATGPAPPNDANYGYSSAGYESGMLVDVSPATFNSVQSIGPPPGYRTRKQREEDERERIRQEAERAAREGVSHSPQQATGKHMKGDMILSDTTLYVEPNWHTSVSAGPTLECDPLCRSPLESVIVELLKHVRPGDVGRVGLTPDQSSPRAYIHFLDAEPASKLLGLLITNASKLLCRVGTHEYRVMRAKPKAGQDYVLRPPCPQIWIRGTVLPDAKLLQNLSRFGSIVGHSRTAREVTITFDSLEAATKAINTLPTERQWWGAYINYAQQAQLISLKSSNPLPGVDLVSLEGDDGSTSPRLGANGEMKPEHDANGHFGNSMSGPRRHARRSRHRQPQHRRSPGGSHQRSQSPPNGQGYREGSPGPVRWPEIDIPQPKKEEPSWDTSLSPNGPPRDSVHHPERSNADWGPRGNPYDQRQPPPGQGDYYQQDRGGPGPGLPPQQDVYRGGPSPPNYGPPGPGYPRYDEPYYGAPPPPMPGNGYGPPPPFYNGPPPPGPYMPPPGPYGYSQPPPGPYPPGPDYYGGGGAPGYGAPNGYGPPQHYGGPPPPQQQPRPPIRFGDGPHSAPFHPPQPHHAGPNSHSAPPTAMHGNGEPSYDHHQQHHHHHQQPMEHQPPHDQVYVKPEPDLDNGLDSTATSSNTGKAPPVNFFRSTMDEREDGTPPAQHSGWNASGEQQQQPSSFRPYSSALSMRR